MKGKRIKRARLDSELVRRGLATSRTEAQRLIDSGAVKVGGAEATKAASLVAPETPIVVAPQEDTYVSRGGLKLDGALRDLSVHVGGRRWIDAGASTGGFTDRLLKGGAGSVIAVDVGYGQLDWRIRNDPRVTVLERTNVRDLAPGELPWLGEGLVADLSFISLRLLIPSFVALVTDDADLVLMVKPQFEVGKEALGKGGVVREPELWKTSIEGVVEAARHQGLGLLGVTVSDLTGPKGNHEFFVHLRRGDDSDMEAIRRAVEAVR